MTDPATPLVSARSVPRLMPGAGAPPLRRDLRLVADLIVAGSRVLDVGCGDGALLDYLEHHKGVDARGVEISQSGVQACVSQGLSVVQGDADTDLTDYPSAAFDYVILSNTLQTVRRPKRVLEELVRIGRHAIVSFPNLGHWRVRLELLARGRAPRTRVLNAPWYETANIHLCTFRDFDILCRDVGITVVRRISVSHAGDPASIFARGPLANLLGEMGVFLLRRGQSPAREGVRRRDRR
ncbi:MAG: methionine biosynthesis protein MetW [Alphaproteobacteria bacterium]|nr:methionine biosynthesis protein MetW [Alphaproteobacteria bacterium]